MGSIVGKVAILRKRARLQDRRAPPPVPELGARDCPERRRRPRSPERNLHRHAEAGRLIDDEIGGGALAASCRAFPGEASAKAMQTCGRQRVKGTRPTAAPSISSATPVGRNTPIGAMTRIMVTSLSALLAPHQHQGQTSVWVFLAARTLHHAALLLAFRLTFGRLAVLRFLALDFPGAMSSDHVDGRRRSWLCRRDARAELFWRDRLLPARLSGCMENSPSAPTAEQTRGQSM